MFLKKQNTFILQSDKDEAFMVSEEEKIIHMLL